MCKCLIPPPGTIYNHEGSMHGAGYYSLDMRPKNKRGKVKVDGKLGISAL